MQPKQKPRKSRSLTVRLDPFIYSAAAEVARARSMSLNALVEEGLSAAILAAEEKARYDDYTLLGQDAEEVDVSYAFAAQAEVVLRDE